jgi:hypothetical protein
MRTAAFVLSALALVACDPGDSPPTFEPTSVPESKPVDELDENERCDGAPESEPPEYTSREFREYSKQ